MNTCILLPEQESMAQHSAAKHNQWRRKMTVHVVNDGIIKSISSLTAVISPDDKM